LTVATTREELYAPATPAGLQRRTAATWIVGLAITVGVVLRLWLALGPLGRPDSDEAVVGLMALRLLHHGQLGAFYWGQSYGGSLEAVLVAPFLALLGTTTLALKLPSILLGLASSWLIWRISRHFFTPPVAAGAALLSLFWPIALVWFGTKERGFYPLTAALGLATVLLAVDIDEQPRRAWLWFGMGVATGVGWWMSPDMAYYALPIAVWLGVRGHGREVRGVGIAIAGLLLGGSVWLVANLQSGFASLSAPSSGGSRYGGRFAFFWTQGLPFASGFRLPWGGEWIFSRGFGLTVALGALATLCIAIVVSSRRSQGWTRSPELFLLAMSPFIFAAFPVNWDLVEGRYLYFVASILPLVLCRVLLSRAGQLMLLSIVAVTFTAFFRDYRRLETTIRPSTASIAAKLRDAGYRTAIADYWVAYQMTFESNEVIVASPTHARDATYRREVLASAPAYVFSERLRPHPDDWLLGELRAAHIAYRTIRVPNFVAVLPQSRYITRHQVR
jgi:Dolichyl-phosphate-mannose-protein mannosyltransferase